MKSPDQIFEPLFAYIEAKSLLQLNDVEKGLISQAFKLKNLVKRQHLLQEGEVCRYMAFILKGAGRMYALKENGQENNVRFAIESWWLGDYESYNLHTPSQYYIAMTEDAEVLLVTNEKIQELIRNIPAVDRMIRQIDRMGAIATQKRIHSAISLGAEERYDQLAKAYPEFIQRFPQSMIASYLGISLETLSRIRKNLWPK